MEQQTPVAPAPPVAAPPTPAPPTSAPTAPAPSKGSPWPWIMGGCLICVILIIGAVLFAGWWGYRTVKKDIQDSSATDGIKNNIDNMNKEGEAWQKKSEDLRNNMPDPEELSNQMQKDAAGKGNTAAKKK